MEFPRGARRAALNHPPGSMTPTANGDREALGSTMAQAPRFQLAESPRRAVETTLQLLDEGLCTIEQWAEGREQRSVLYAETNDLSAAQREKLLQEVAAIRRELREARETMGLSPRSLGAAKDIWALCSGLRVDLMEMESKRLRGYGRITGKAADHIDGTSHRLQAAFDRIVAILSSGSSS